MRWSVFGAPILASFGAALAVRALLPAPDGMLARAAALALLIAVSTLVLLVIDRLSRRALPLVTLLDLAMLFPDHAPSRLGLAREAIRRRPIEEQLQRVRAAGADPGAVAREILALVAAMSAHDRPTRGHAERVRMFTDLLAEEMGVPERDRDLLRWAAILHDIGKLRVPSTLLNKAGRVTPEEWTLLRSHPSHGADMAAGLLPWLGEWGAVIVEHHERYDGTGYPQGLSGAQTSLGARIVAVADAYDVMTSARVYKRPVGRAAALRELVRFSGIQFDPAVVRAMVAVGAPRLRRAQGVVAWIADIPLVATGTVPASTVAHIVGAGALATATVTGGSLVGASLEPTPRPQSAISAPDSAQGRHGPVTSVSSAADRETVAEPAGRSGGGTSAQPAPTGQDEKLGKKLPSPEPGSTTLESDAGAVKDTGVVKDTGDAKDTGVVKDKGDAKDTGAVKDSTGSGSSTGTEPSPAPTSDEKPTKEPASPIQDAGQVAPEATIGVPVDPGTGTPSGTAGTQDQVAVVTGTAGALLDSGSSGASSSSGSSGSSGGGSGSQKERVPAR